MPSIIRGSDNFDSATSGLNLATAVTASGTAVDFTSIPSWVKRITLSLHNVETNGTANLSIQAINASGAVAVGYTMNSFQVAGTNLTSNDRTDYFLIYKAATTNTLSGNFVLVKHTDTAWTGSGSVRAGATRFTVTGGSVDLPLPLTGIRLATANGTDVFNSGTINIMYEG